VEELRSLVVRGRAGDLDAFGEIVRRFQDMAYGYAYAILGDFHLAEDAAQEAFIEAYRCLPMLREPAAFPGWFRRIVFKRCDRLTRRKRVRTAPLESVGSVTSKSPGPPENAERREMRDKVLDAIRSLPDAERMVTTLYYIDGYSQKDVADFLEVPVTTVNNRLHASRQRLKERMLTMVSDELKSYSLPPGFFEMLKEKLNGQIIELPDGRIQVFYDFVDAKQLNDWRVFEPYKATPEIRERGLAFGRIEPEQTENQWDRDVRLNLVLDPDPQTELTIDFDVTMGTSEPWSCAAWVLTRRDGYGPGIPFFEGVITDHDEEWRQDPERNEGGLLKDGHIRADFLRRYVGDTPDDYIWAVPPQAVLMAESYHMRVMRENRKLRWEINGQPIGETGLAHDELCLTERLVLCNYGKGTGAVFRNMVLRSRIVDVDPSWPTADRENTQNH